MATHNVKVLPFSVYFIFVALIGLVGLFDAIYLSWSHYNVYTDIDYRSFCAISKAINCDTVSQSPYSVFLGIPIPVWGILGYAIVLLLLFNAWRHRNSARKAFWPSLFFVSLLYALNSIFLAVISAVVIHSHCIMCILSHAVNFGLLFFSWLIYRRFENQSIFAGLIDDLKHFRRHRRPWGVALIVLGLGVVGLILFFPAYWEIVLKTPDAPLNHGVTSEGYPWIGAEAPEFVITEFSDYQCFQCKKMHYFLRHLIVKHHDRLRLVHRHFPMDQRFNPLVVEPYHPGSGQMAMMALYAQEKDMFWKINDLLFDLAAKKKDFNTATVAEEMNITSGELVAALNNQYIRLRLKHDIAVGIAEGVTGTPGFVIDGNIYTGTIPREILKTMLSLKEEE